MNQTPLHAESGDEVAPDTASVESCDEEDHTPLHVDIGYEIGIHTTSRRER